MTSRRFAASWYGSGEGFWFLTLSPPTMVTKNPRIPPATSSGSISTHELERLGGQPFNMTVAGLRLSARANAVAELHGETARQMWSHVRRVAPGVFVVNARAAVSEVNERFGWNLPQGDYETLGGLVLERLGRVPKPGDGVQAGRVHIEVTRSSARAVQELRVRERRAPERSG